MPTIMAPRGVARTPNDLGSMPLRGKHITEDVAAWTQAAHDINRQMALEMHAFAVILRRRLKGGGNVVERFAVSAAARRATRPLLKAASQADDAANGCHRFWRAFIHQVSEIQAARRGSRRGSGLGAGT